ncbi:hypothetical protein H0O00_00555 [Candidatus Micrarchaeota archaeon]|nr:hypothetical protein [Candidatus Micrarchaeota archaeon]
MSKIIIAILVFGLILAPLAFAADCAAASYRKACASCSFDEHGKIDSLGRLQGERNRLCEHKLPHNGRQVC